jgi:REP element-mobilizing transposase RayT
MDKSSIKFYQYSFYHIYNRGNNRGKIFFTKQNYLYFLKQFDYYLSEYIDVFAYALIPNHFHFLIRVKPIENTDNITLQFRKFFISYSKSINKQFDRSGSLFQKNFKRKVIEESTYLTRIILYIHANPQKHKCVKDFKEYRFSSYNGIIGNKSTKLNRNEVLEWFGGKENFVKFHDDNKYIDTDLSLIEEDD